MPSLAEFLTTLDESQLVPAAKVEAVRAALDEKDREDLAAVVRALVERRFLTKFQASKILQGKKGPFILGKFKILNQLGSGGMGKVYYARDQETRAKVALKVLPPGRARAERSALMRFEREGNLSLGLSHPNVAETLEVGEHSGVHFLVMEYIPGETLYDMVRDGGPLRVWDAARLFSEAAKGLGHVHRVGLIHRDIKPSNIMVTPGGDVKILDLGLARHQEEEEQITRPGAVVGTMDYVAPEQASSPERTDGRSDIYSLGCTLYFSLARRPPFPGGDMMSKVVRHRLDEPEPLERIAHQVPREFAMQVRKMMAKNPNDRYQDTEELIREFATWQDADYVRGLLGVHADTGQVFRTPDAEMDSTELHFVDDLASLRSLGAEDPADSRRPSRSGSRVARSPRPSAHEPPVFQTSPAADDFDNQANPMSDEPQDDSSRPSELGGTVFGIVTLGSFLVLVIWLWIKYNQ